MEKKSSPLKNRAIDFASRSAATLRARLHHFRAEFHATKMGAARVWITLGLFSFALLYFGQMIGDRNGLLIGFFLALAMNSVVLFYGDLRLAHLFQGQTLEGRDGWGVLTVARVLSRQMKIKMPALSLVDAETPFIYSAGVLARHSTIYISNSLLDQFDTPEVRAVLAFELRKIKTQRTAVMTATAALAGFFFLAAQSVDNALLLRFLSEKRREHARGLLISGPMTLIVSPFILFLTRAIVRRTSVFDNDEETVDVLGEAHPLASALWKLDAYSKTKPFTVNAAEAHLFMVSPRALKNGWNHSWFAVHPRVETRIRRLIGRFPI